MQSSILDADGHHLKNESLVMFERRLIVMVVVLRSHVSVAEVILGMCFMVNSSLLVTLVTVLTPSHFDFVLMLIWRILVMRSLQLGVSGEYSTISLRSSEYSRLLLAIQVV